MRVPHLNKPALISLITLLVIIVFFVISSSQWGVWLGVRQPPKVPVGTILTMNLTAYSSSPYQTDANPCQTAAGTTVRSGIAATNLLPLGTVVQVTDVNSQLNNSRYIIEDRTNPRVAALDVWMPSTQDALNYGRESQVAVTVIAYRKPGDFARMDGIEKVAPLGFWRRLSLLLRAQLQQPDVNKYDVDCSSMVNDG